jgi:hypothetical protein
MELKGRFTSKLLKKAKFSSDHFDEQYNFVTLVKDKSSGSVSSFSYVFKNLSSNKRTGITSNVDHPFESYQRLQISFDAA